MAQPFASATGGLLETEPVAAVVAAATLVVDAGLALAKTMGWVDLTDGQLAAVLTFVSALAAAAAAAARANVVSPATHNEAVMAAYEEGTARGSTAP